MLKKIYIVLLMTLCVPFSSILAFSDNVIVGGENVGIMVKTKGVLVVGLYKVDNELIAASTNIKPGDYITKINNVSVNNIDDFSREINNDSDKESIDIEFKRGNKTYNTNLKLKKVDNDYKTGLYVKDTVSGIGTLTFIDPNTKTFGALGHQILDSSSNNILNINDGSIYHSYITGINKSTNGKVGEKESLSEENKVYGDIKENTIRGIFGKYDNEINNSKLTPVAKNNEIVLGGASILTVVSDDEVKEFKINIDKIDYNDKTKNILFTITDEELLSKTGGVVQGMSGSPIMQNGKLIGAVTHAIVDDCKRGYGIFITNMLEEADN